MIGSLTRMAKFYRKPKLETMLKNRETYRKEYAEEIQWIKENLTNIQKYNNFLSDMYIILISGSRKITPKMKSTIINSIAKCKNSPIYNKKLRDEAKIKLSPILGKINVVLAMAEAKNDRAVSFIQNILDYVKTNHRITKKQMEALNKVHKRVSEDLFDPEKPKDEPEDIDNETK